MWLGSNELASDGPAPSRSVKKWEVECNGDITADDASRRAAPSPVMVILPHSAGLFAYWPSPSLPTRVMITLCEFGHVGVQVFFVLSGFVIAYTLRGQLITVRYLFIFIFRRSIGSTRRTGRQLPFTLCTCLSAGPWRLEA